MSEAELHAFVTFASCSGRWPLALSWPVSVAFLWAALDRYGTGRSFTPPSSVVHNRMPSLVKFQLGHGDKVNKTQPTLVEGLLSHPLVQVTCGWSHTVGLTATGKVSHRRNVKPKVIKEMDRF